MATEETEVKNYFRKEMERYAKAAKIVYAILPNSANEMTEKGRADTDLILHNCIYVHVEFKAAGKDLSPAQDVFFSEERHGAIQLVLAGKEEVDAFFERLGETLSRITPELNARILGTTARIIYGHRKYVQDKQKREDAAAKRPKRQSPHLNQKLH